MKPDPDSMSFPAYPMLLVPRLDPKIWGGRRLETILGKNLPSGDRIGESLESDARSQVANGVLAGQSIEQLIEIDARTLLGTGGMLASEPFNDFPLLAKFIDASDTLSVQVHPNDEEAAPLGKRGKTEAWYIVDADPGATLITGLKPGLSTTDIAEAIDSARLGELVVEQTVRAGDTLLIPAGTTHAIGAGVLLYEIQQASDVTFRMYDWGRLDDSGQPRELHVKESLQVVKPGLRADRIAPLHFAPNQWIMAASRFFTLERWDLNNTTINAKLSGWSFRLVSAISGSATVTVGDFTVDLAAGQTVLIPAHSAGVSVSGLATLLVSYVPNLERDVINPLLATGHAREDIDRLAGMLGHLETG
jgi:mannose-6-phosphate isomerase